MEKNLPVKIACIQMDILPGDIDKNIERASEMIEQACDNGATLIVLPETFNTSFSMKNRKEAYTLAETIPSGRTTQHLMELAKKRDIYICGSLLELEGVDIYNTSILVGPDGFIGKYRKLHPCEEEVYYVEPGNLGIPVFHTPIGRIALNVCLDAYYPETFRIAALQGADIVCCQFNSRDVKEARELPDPYHTMATVLCMANALSNHIYVVCCNRVGRCNTTTYGNNYGGQSAIANPWGAPVSGVASAQNEEIIYADVDLSDSRRKYFHPTNSRLANRRVDVYSQMLGYEASKHPRQ